MFPQSHRLTASILAVAIAASTLTAVAQTKSKSSTSKSKATATSKKTSKYHRLPAHYGQLKLKDEQVKEIYSIRDAFGKKIDDLEAELAELKEDQAKDIKDVLTRTQVTALNKLIAGTATRTTSKKTSTRKPTTKKSTSSKK